jgi:DNA repair protein RadC
VSPEGAAAIFQNLIGNKDKEHLMVMVLDTKYYVLAVETVYVGTINSIIVRIGELFQEAVKLNGCAIIIGHNHPSGDPTPSPDDVNLTHRIVDAGNILDVEVMDHIVVGPFAHYSLKGHGLGGL